MVMTSVIMFSQESCIERVFVWWVGRGEKSLCVRERCLIVVIVQYFIYCSASSTRIIWACDEEQFGLEL